MTKNEAVLPDRDTMVQHLMDHRLIATERPLFESLISPYPESVLPALYRMSLKNKPYARAVCELIVEERKPLSLVNEAFAFGHLVRKTGPYINGVSVAATLRALHHYSPHLPDMEDYSEASEQVKIQIEALITVADILLVEFLRSKNDTRLPVVTTYDQYGSLCLLIDGDDLIQYVINRPDKARQIAAIITERYTGHVDLIDSILNSDAPSVSSGQL